MHQKNSRAMLMFVMNPANRKFFFVILLGFLAVIFMTSTSTGKYEDNDEKETKNILCTTAERSLSYPSFNARCKLLADDFKRYAPNYHVDVIGMAEVPKNKQYVATISVKYAQPTYEPRFGKIFIDVVDDYNLGHKNPLPGKYGVITQNYAHAKTFIGSRSAYVIDHPYSIRDQIIYKDTPTEMFSLKKKGTLTILSISGGEAQTSCLDPRDNDVVYNCLYADRHVEEVVSSLTYTSNTAIQSILQLPNSEAMFFDLLFQQHDVVIVYEKPTENKHRFGSVQRIINAMKSGTASIVQRVEGGVFAHFLDFYNYDCWFSDPDSFAKLVANMRSEEDRRWCQKQAEIILTDFKPQVILQKYLSMIDESKQLR